MAPPRLSENAKNGVLAVVDVCASKRVEQSPVQGPERTTIPMLAPRGAASSAASTMIASNTQLGATIRLIDKVQGSVELIAEISAPPWRRKERAEPFSRLSALLPLT